MSPTAPAGAWIDIRRELAEWWAAHEHTRSAFAGPSSRPRVLRGLKSSLVCRGPQRSPANRLISNRCSSLPSIEVRIGPALVSTAVERARRLGVAEIPELRADKGTQPLVLVEEERADRIGYIRRNSSAFFSENSASL